jgi:hypothetical protein
MDRRKQGDTGLGTFWPDIGKFKGRRWIVGWFGMRTSPELFFDDSSIGGNSRN